MTHPFHRTPEQKWRYRIDAHWGFHQVEHGGDYCGYLKGPYVSRKKREVKGKCALTGRKCVESDLVKNKSCDCEPFRKWQKERTEQLRNQPPIDEDEQRAVIAFVCGEPYFHNYVI